MNPIQYGGIPKPRTSGREEPRSIEDRLESARVKTDFGPWNVLRDRGVELVPNYHEFSAFCRAEISAKEPIVGVAGLAHVTALAVSGLLARVAYLEDEVRRLGGNT